MPLLLLVVSFSVSRLPNVVAITVEYRDVQNANQKQFASPFMLSGYDSGYISGVIAMKYFIHVYTGLPIPGPDASAAETAAFVLSSSHQSLIVSILSAGTFFGAIIAGDLADWFGRRKIVILG